MHKQLDTTYQQEQNIKQEGIRTVHASARVSLPLTTSSTAAGNLIPNSTLNFHNLFNSSVVHYRPILKILWKSTNIFSSYPTNRKSNKQMTVITVLPQQIA